MRIDKLVQYASPDELKRIMSATFEAIGFDPSDSAFTLSTNNYEKHQHHL